MEISMNLDDQIASARKKVHREGYDMSFGELASMYARDEMVINPEYQRLFRWEPEKKTSFVESLLLNIPIPPIFVFTDKEGRWELVDGLQRVSTVFETMGILKNAHGEVLPPLVCEETNLLPDLKGRQWHSNADDTADGTDKRYLNQSQQLSIRRSRIRVEILDQFTDAEVKFELFQRLNTGGTNLSEQEVRNCTIASMSNKRYKRILGMSGQPSFVAMTDVGLNREKRQYRMELVVRFLVLRNFEYQPGTDVHKYLDRGIISILQNEEFDWVKEEDTFNQTMEMLFEAAGSEAFRRNKRFSLGQYEFATLGLSKAIETGKAADKAKIKKKISGISALPEAKKYSGMGVGGALRLSKFIMPVAESYFS
jgi:hypothetical protein